MLRLTRLGTVYKQLGWAVSQSLQVTPSAILPSRWLPSLRMTWSQRTAGRRCSPSVTCVHRALDPSKNGARAQQRYGTARHAYRCTNVVLDAQCYPRCSRPLPALTYSCYHMPTLQIGYKCREEWLRERRKGRGQRERGLETRRHSLLSQPHTYRFPQNKCER